MEKEDPRKGVWGWLSGSKGGVGAKRREADGVVRIRAGMQSLVSDSGLWVACASSR